MCTCLVNDWSTRYVNIWDKEQHANTQCSGFLLNFDTEKWEVKSVISGFSRNQLDGSKPTRERIDYTCAARIMHNAAGTRLYAQYCDQHDIVKSQTYASRWNADDNPHTPNFQRSTTTALWEPTPACTGTVSGTYFSPNRYTSWQYSCTCRKSTPSCQVLASLSQFWQTRWLHFHAAPHCCSHWNYAVISLEDQLQLAANILIHIRPMCLVFILRFIPRWFCSESPLQSRFMAFWVTWQRHAQRLLSLSPWRIPWPPTVGKCRTA